MRLEPVAPRSRVKHSTTKPVRSLVGGVVCYAESEHYVHTLCMSSEGSNDTVPMRYKSQTMSCLIWNYMYIKTSKIRTTIFFRNTRSIRNKFGTHWSQRIGPIYTTKGALCAQKLGNGIFYQHFFFTELFRYCPH